MKTKSFMINVNNRQIPFYYKDTPKDTEEIKCNDMSEVLIESIFIKKDIC